MSKVLEVEGVSIYLYHGHLPLDLEPAAGGFDVVVSGHSHRPKIEERGNVLYLNPGSAGRKRFRLPVSLANLTIDANEVKAELIFLET